MPWVLVVPAAQEGPDPASKAPPVSSRATTRARLLALDLDPVRLAEANAHRIPVYTDEAKKKINPIKASKRGLKG